MSVPISSYDQPLAAGVRAGAIETAAAEPAELACSQLSELFIVKAGEHAFTWELRRISGALLERGIEAFASEALAHADGDAVLSTLCASQPDL